MGLDLTAYDAGLKELYTGQRMEFLVNDDRPLLAMLPKMQKFHGKKYPLPVQYGDPQSRGATFSEAQSRASSVSSRVEAFDLTRVNDHQIVIIDNETLEASASSAGAWMEARKLEIDSAINNMSNALEFALFRGGWGAIGTISSSTGSTITLTSLGDAHQFAKGLQVQFAQSESGHVLRDSGDYLEVLSVNRRTGVVTFTGAVSGIASIADGDYIFVKGDRQDSATPTRRRPAGLAAWAPATAPTSGDSFFGVDRSADSLLYGQYHNGASDPVEDAFIDAINKVAEFNYKVDHIFCSYAQFAKLTKNLTDNRRYVDVEVGEVGFRAFEINGPRGMVKVVPSIGCQRNTAWAVQLDKLKLCSLDEPVRLNDSGGAILRQASADGVEVRVVSRVQLGCMAPASICQIALTTV